MDKYESLSHPKWDCKYHVVFIPKCRRKALYEELRRPLGEVFRQLAGQKESRIEEGHLMPDHVPMKIREGMAPRMSRMIELELEREMHKIIKESGLSPQEFSPKI